MVKTIFALLAAFVSLVPAISLAQGVGAINGNGASNQFLATSTGTTTMHMEIIAEGGNQHTFRWDNTPWRVDQGGTGQSYFTPGALLFGNGTSALGMTGAGTLGYVLQFNGSIPTWVSTSSLGISGDGTPGGLNTQIQFNNGGSLDGIALSDTDGSSHITLGDKTFAGPWIYVDQNESSMGFGTDIFTFNVGDAFLQTAGELDFVSDTVIFQTGGSVSFQQQSTGAFAVNNGSVRFNPTDNLIKIQNGILDFSSLALSGDKTFTFPNFSGTFGLLEADQTWTGNNTFSKGTGTTTVTFGTPGDTSSKVCFNTKNTDGQSISFYFVGTSMVVENNACQ